MRKVTFSLGLLLAGALVGQTNITQLGHVDYHALHGSDLSNLWGYADEEGNEYALVGVNGNGPQQGGLSIVDVTDPANAHEVAFVPSANSIWREIKVWNDHAYVTTEAEAGLLIVDLSPLPQSTDLPSTVFQGDGWITSHSLFIDENGRLFVNGANRSVGGCIMYDLTQDPMAPVEVGSYELWYVHDCFARGDTLYAAHIYDGFFSMVDVSDPAAPVLLGTRNTPNNFTHNVWLDDSGQYLFTTDERGGAYVGAYDVSDPTDIQEVDRLQSDPGSNTIPHNTYWLNDFLVTSYYTYGVTIYDATRPGNLVETGNFDTSPFSGDGFHGAWGVYPFLPSGHLLVSDIEQGLFILGPTYVHACWLEGGVTDAQTGDPIPNAGVSVTAVGQSDVTDVDGRYGLGTLTPGTYAMTVHASGYADAEVNGIVLANGEVTIQDVALEPLATTVLSVHIKDAVTHAAIPNAHIHIAGGDVDYDVTTDALGNFSTTPFFLDDYTITVGQWGWRTICEQPFTVTAQTNDRTVELTKGYEDDFLFDYGWSVVNTSTTGHWERAVPQGTVLGNDQVAPAADAGDCGDQAFVTGNGGDQPGTNDIDNGLTTLTSPVFDLTDLDDPYVLYQHWFYDSFTSNPANDTLTVLLDNGSTTAVLEKVTMQNTTMSQWLPHAVHVSDHLTPTAAMRLIVIAGDYPQENLAEGGFDAFLVVNGLPTGVDERAFSATPMIVPNPSSGGFDVRVASGKAIVDVLDLQGRQVVAPQVLSAGTLHIGSELPPAVYLVRVTRPDGTINVVRAVVQ